MTSSLSLDEDYQMLGKQNDETMSYRNLMSDIGQSLFEEIDQHAVEQVSETDPNGYEKDYK